MYPTIGKMALLIAGLIIGGNLIGFTIGYAGKFLFALFNVSTFFDIPVFLVFYVTGIIIVFNYTRTTEYQEYWHNYMRKDSWLR